MKIRTSKFRNLAPLIPQFSVTISEKRWITSDLSSGVCSLQFPYSFMLVFLIFDIPVALLSSVYYFLSGTGSLCGLVPLTQMGLPVSVPGSAPAPIPYLISPGRNQDHVMLLELGLQNRWRQCFIIMPKPRRLRKKMRRRKGKKGRSLKQATKTKEPRRDDK